MSGNVYSRLQIMNNAFMSQNKKYNNTIVHDSMFLFIVICGSDCLERFTYHIPVPVL